MTNQISNISILKQFGISIGIGKVFVSSAIFFFHLWSC